MLDYIGYAGNAFIIVSACSITIAPKLSLKPHLFFLFLVGHLLWLYVAMSRGDVPLSMLNTFFVGLDIVGILMRTVFKNKTLSRS